jgi:hypothetical protein
VLYGFVPLETRIARDSRVLGLSRRCRESSFHLRKFGSFHSASVQWPSLVLPGGGRILAALPPRQLFADTFPYSPGRWRRSCRCRGSSARSSAWRPLPRARGWTPPPPPGAVVAGGAGRLQLGLHLGKLNLDLVGLQWQLGGRK